MKNEFNNQGQKIANGKIIWFLDRYYKKLNYKVLWLTPMIIMLVSVIALIITGATTCAAIVCEQGYLFSIWEKAVFLTLFLIYLVVAYFLLREADHLPLSGGLSTIGVILFIPIVATLVCLFGIIGWTFLFLFITGNNDAIIRNVPQGNFWLWKLVPRILGFYLVLGIVADAIIIFVRGLISILCFFLWGYFLHKNKEK